ncbi:HigA family addiction module antitoxin [Dongia sp.]|uniref:HigA family addiction module antitoxin n=1 Tax=Dongia sp. TaxID=1977262 RepID=UPI0035B0101D
MKPIVIHPGEVLLEEFMRPLNISADALGLALHVPADRILAIAKGRHAVSADTALRLSRYFGTTAEFWLNLQARYDLKKATAEEGSRIRQEVRPRAA